MKDGQYCKKAVDGLKEILPGSAQLVFTSPPFNCGIDYDVWQDDMDWAHYTEMMVETFREAYDVLCDGGRCAVDIPPVIKVGKKRVDMHRFFYNVLEHVGFQFRDVIHWLKGKDLKQATRYNSTNWGTWCSPVNPSVRSFQEVILVMCKGKYDLPDAGPSDLEKEEFPIFTNSIWTVPGRADVRHPAVFPEEIPRRMIKLFTGAGDLVVDPFAGIGTTLVVARRLGRRYVGFDVSSRYCEIANGQLSQQLITGY